MNRNRLWAFRGASLLLGFMVGFDLDSMQSKLKIAKTQEQELLVEADAETSPLRLIDPAPLGVFPDIWKKHIFPYVGYGLKIGEVFNYVGTLRRVNRSFNNFFHDEEFVGNLFKNGMYPESISYNKVICYYMSLYLGALVSQNLFRDVKAFIKLFDTPGLTYSKLFEYLTGYVKNKGPLFPVFTRDMPSLLKFCMALILLDKDLRDDRYLPDCFMAQYKDQRFWADFFHSLYEHTVLDQPELKKQELYKVCHSLFPPQRDPALVSTELTYTNLFNFLGINRAELDRGGLPWQETGKDVKELLQELEHFNLSQDQRNIFEAAQCGDLSVIKRLLSTKRDPVFYVVADLALLIALKSRQIGFAQCLIEKIPIEERENYDESSNLVMHHWLMWEVIALGDQDLCTALAQHLCTISSQFSSVNDPVAKRILISVSRLTNIAARCAVDDGVHGFSPSEPFAHCDSSIAFLRGIFLFYNLPASSLCAFFKACFTENLDAINSDLMLNLEPEIQGALLGAAIAFGVNIGSPKLLRVLRKYPDAAFAIMDVKKNLVRVLSRVPPSRVQVVEEFFGELDPIEMVSRLKDVELKLGRFAKLKCRENFEKYLAAFPLLNNNDVEIIKAASSDDRDFIPKQFFTQASVGDKPIDSLLYDLAVLAALSCERWDLAGELVKNFPKPEEDLYYANAHFNLSMYMLLFSIDKETD